MPKIVMEEYEEFPTLPADTIVSVKVDSIFIKELQGQRGAWQKAEFTFKILGVPSDQYAALIGQKIYGSVPFRFTESPDNKLRQWVEAIFGMELTAGFELDTDLLIGREARGIVANYDKKAKDPRTGNPCKGHQISDLLPKGGSGLAQAAPAAVTNVTNNWVAPPAPQPVAAGGWSDDPPPF